jgi:carboxypeptidase Taq
MAVTMFGLALASPAAAANRPDPWIDAADPGMTTAKVRQLFSALRERLVPFVAHVAAQPAPDGSFLRGHFDKSRQLAFGEEIIRSMGYDFDRGRQDETHHPFMTRFAAGDVRITTRVREDDLSEALFSTIHEAGHALYEQNIDPGFDGTPLGHGASMGLHESQSRLWENMVARSLPFWRHFYPKLQRTFPDALAGVDVEPGAGRGHRPGRWAEGAGPGAR